MLSAKEISNSQGSADGLRQQLALCLSSLPNRANSSACFSLFDEHVTSTPTFYINEVRYTGN